MSELKDFNGLIMNISREIAVGKRVMAAPPKKSVMRAKTRKVSFLKMRK